jgi:chromosome segregation ATPase
MLSRFFRGGNAGGGKVQQQDDDRDTLVHTIERLNREIGDFEKLALDKSTEAERLRAELEAAKKGAKQLRKMINELTAQHATAMHQQRHDLTLEIIKLGERVTAATAARDTATANFEWARLMFNKGEAERAILTSRIIERPVQPFSIEREASPPPPTDGTAGAAGEPAAGVDRPKPTAAIETAIGGLANRFGVIFEDVGDDEAKRQGLEHEDA